MFREMRRIKQELPLDEAKKLLKENKRGVLSFNGDDNYPYSLPINYFYDDEENRIYFHGAKTGYKIDCIEKNNKSCYLKSVIAFGKIEIVKDQELAARKLSELASRYYPSLSEVDAAMVRSFKNVLVYYLDIEHMTCKRVHEK